MELNSAERRDLVLQALGGYSGRKVQGSYYTMICCPYHADKTPSGTIFHGPNTKVMGFFLCRGCGERKSWNELATTMGWPTFGKVAPSDKFVTELRSLEVPKKEEKPTSSFTLEELPPGYKWRGFSTEFLSKVGAQLGVYDRSGRKFVYLPVIVGKRERGYIRAAIRKDPERPSYLNKKGSWSKTHGLFPFDYAIKVMRRKELRTVVLVEGPRDALRLLYYSIPAISILGTQTWTARKAALLELHGVKKVVLMMDGDPAGAAAEKLIAPDVRSLMKAEIFDLRKFPGSPYPEWAELDEDEQKEQKGNLWDPGNCPKDVLRTLKQCIS